MKSLLITIFFFSAFSYVLAQKTDREKLTYIFQGKDCPIIKLPRLMEFQGFTIEEIDTILVKQFIANDSFDKFVDSFFIFTQKPEYYSYEDSMRELFSVHLYTLGMYSNYEYEFVLSNSERVRISKITLGKIRFLRHGDPECVMVSYKINGKYLNDQNIYVEQKDFQERFDKKKWWSDFPEGSPEYKEGRKRAGIDR